MKVRVTVYMTLREKLGWSSKVVELKQGSRLRDLLDALPRLRDEVRNYEDMGFQPVILVNGRHHVFLGGLDAPLSDGDEVAVFPPAAGG